MTLAEKITSQHKRAGLSQEDPAAKVMVSRQAVSKWESGRSVPDLDRIVTLSEVFGATTDYLLKDERLGTTTFDEASGAEEGNQFDRAVAPDALTHAVSLREAEDFLAINRKTARSLASASSSALSRR